MISSTQQDNIWASHVQNAFQVGSWSSKLGARATQRHVKSTFRIAWTDFCTHEHVCCFLFINFAVMNSILAECSWIQVEWSVWIRWFPLNFRVLFANILNIWEKLYYSSLAPILDSLYPIETAHVSQAIRFIHVTMLQTDFCPSTCEMEVYGDMWMLSEENTLWGQKGPTGMRHLSPDNLLKVCFLELMIGLVFLMISLE